MDTQMTLAQVAWKLGELAREGGCRYDAHDMSVMCSQMADSVNSENKRLTAELAECRKDAEKVWKEGFDAGEKNRNYQSDHSAWLESETYKAIGTAMEKTK